MRIAPRMGNSKRFALLVAGSKADQYEYASGLVFLGSFFLVFFFMWGFCIFVCRWLGPEQVGLFSGDVMTPSKPKARLWVHRNKVKFVRHMFCMAAFVWIIFVVVFLAVSITGMNEAKSMFMESADVRIQIECHSPLPSPVTVLIYCHQPHYSNLIK